MVMIAMIPTWLPRRQPCCCKAAALLTSCTLQPPPASQTWFYNNFDCWWRWRELSPGVKVFQVREGGETFAVEEKMLVQHFVPGHRDHCGAGNGGGCGQ